MTPLARLGKAVKRNIERLPADFTSELTQEEARSLRSQFVTLKPGRGEHRKCSTYNHFGNREFEITICDLKWARRASAPSARLHGAGSGDALGRAAQFARRASERRDHAGLRQASADAAEQRGAGAPAGTAVEIGTKVFGAKTGASPPNPLFLFEERGLRWALPSDSTKR